MSTTKISNPPIFWKYFQRAAARTFRAAAGLTRDAAAGGNVTHRGRPFYGR